MKKSLIALAVMAAAGAASAQSSVTLFGIVDATYQNFGKDGALPTGPELDTTPATTARVWASVARKTWVAACPPPSGWKPANNDNGRRCHQHQQPDFNATSGATPRPRHAKA